MLPVVDPRQLTLDTVNDAYAMVTTGSNAGKVVVDVPAGAR